MNLELYIDVMLEYFKYTCIAYPEVVIIGAFLICLGSLLLATFVIRRLIRRFKNA